MDGFPTEKSECARLALAFSTSRANNNPLHGCIGALDGIAVRLSKPRAADCIDPASYYHRKGYYAIPVQAICDSNYRFMFFSAKCAGPTHDSVAFEVSSYAENLRNGLLPDGFWVAADDAYVSDENIITPLPVSESTPGSHGDAFNFYQSSHRMHIEQAFGILMARWGILWRPLRFSLSQNIRVFKLAMCLHNFCIECADSSSSDLMSADDFHEIEEYTASLTAIGGSAGSSGALPGRSSQAKPRSHRLRQQKLPRRVLTPTLTATIMAVPPAASGKRKEKRKRNLASSALQDSLPRNILNWKKSAKRTYQCFGTSRLVCVLLSVTNSAISSTTFATRISIRTEYMALLSFLCFPHVSYFGLPNTPRKSPWQHKSANDSVSGAKEPTWISGRTREAPPSLHPALPQQVIPQNGRWP